MKLLAWLLLLTGVCASPLHAQDPPKVSVRAGVFPDAGNDKFELLLTEGGNSLPIEAWGGDLAPPVDLPRLAVWRFGYFKEEKDSAGKTKKTFVERGKVTPVAARRQWLLFFPASADPSGPVAIKAYGADDSAIREGGALILNLTKAEVAGKISKSPFRLASGESVVVDPETKRGDEYPILFVYPFEGQPRTFAESRWFHGERRRRIALIIQPPDATFPQLFTVTDIMSAPGEPAKTP